MKISTKLKTEVSCLPRNPSQCKLQVSGNTLHQVEKFKYLGVVFTSDGRQNKEIDTRVGKANAVLCELYHSVATDWKLSNTAKLSVFKSVAVPILTHRHESCAMTERVLSQMQAAELGFLRRLHGVPVHNELCSCEIRKALNIEPLFRNERSQLRWFGHVSGMSHERLARQVLLVTPGESGSKVVQGPGGVTTSPTLLGPRLGAKPAKLSEIAVDHRIFRILGLLPPRPSP